VHGLTAGTRSHYLRYARRFITRWVHTLDWSTLTADTVTDFVRTEAGRLKPCACRGPVTATRAMLRFLLTSGSVPPGLLGAVPTVRQWKLSTLPRYLTDEQLACVLQLGKTPHPLSLRDHAVLLLMARLGLRAGEVARLTLDDLDWSRGCLRVRPGKCVVERQLPLSQELAEALLAYLRARGSVPELRFVFLCAGAPHHRPLSAGAITCIAKRALRQAGITVVRPGAHVFRHTAATQMVRRGVAFKQVADILGHRLLQTTTVYAKLDIDQLARLALPWPGGKP
jgi:site-specific recombinase XerD